MAITSIAFDKKKYDFESLDKLATDIAAYEYCLVYYNDGVKVEKAKAVENLDKFIELRAFDETGELHIIKTDDGIVGRTVTDGSGEAVKIYDELQLVWGKPYKSENGQTLLKSDRGTNILLPFEVDSDKRVFVQVRNYINENHADFNFTDWRIVGFESINAKEAE